MHFQEMTSPQLVEHFNSLNPEKPMKSWKGKKSVLIEKIAELTPATDRTVRECALELLGFIAYYEDRAKSPGPDNIVDPDFPGARSVGIPYNEVIDGIYEEFPACKTSIACLRWYSVKVRAGEEGYENYDLPQRRPRVKAKK